MKASWIYLPLIVFLPGLLFFNQTGMDTTRTASDSSGSAIQSTAGDTLLVTAITPVYTFPVVENRAFTVGEKLTFAIRYGFIHAGTARMEVKQETLVKDRLCYQITTVAKSASGFDFIYKVDDVVESFVDKEGLFSWLFIKKLREGGYKADLRVDYFPGDSLADVVYTRYKGRMKVYKIQNYKVKTPPFVMDVLAALYYTRTQDLKVGKSLFITNHDNKKIYDLEVKVYSEEVVETNAGKFKCLLIEPLLKGEGIFKQEGRLKIWVTNDRYKLPVIMTSEVAVGHITTELEKIEGIPGIIPARLPDNE
jgi:hypothetical protein